MGSHTAGAFARTLQSSRKSRRSARADIENGANVLLNALVRVGCGRTLTGRSDLARPILSRMSCPVASLRIWQADRAMGDARLGVYPPALRPLTFRGEVT